MRPDSRRPFDCNLFYCFKFTLFHVTSLSREQQEKRHVEWPLPLPSRFRFVDFGSDKPRSQSGPHYSIVCNHDMPGFVFEPPLIVDETQRKRCSEINGQPSS